MSLSSRLIWTVTLTVAIAFAAFVAVTTWRLNEATNGQKLAIERRIQAKFVEQLDLEGQLTASFLERVEESVDASVSALAGRNETRELIERGNIVAIDLTMQKAATSYGLDSVIVLDRGLKAIGSHKPGLNLLSVNDTIAQSENIAAVTKLLDQVNRDAPVSERFYRSMDRDMAIALGMELSADTKAIIAVVSVHPVFDDFGDVFALVVAHRMLSGDDVVMQRFAQSRNLGVELLSGEQILMRAGLKTGRSGAQFYLSQCNPFKRNWKVCVHTPRSEMTAETQALTNAVVAERDALIRWVALLSLVSLILAVLVSSFVTHRVMAPLEQITRAVRSVARGNWMAKVSGKSRGDEVGEIARAVTVFQQSVKEREQLQADVADVETLRESREALMEAFDACSANVRRQMFRMSGKSEQIETSLSKLVSLMSLAEGEADEARLIGIRLSEKPHTVVDEDAQTEASVQAKLMRDAVDRLCETINTINRGSLDLGDEVTGFMGDVGNLDRTVKRFLSEIKAVPTLTGPVSAPPIVTEHSAEAA